MAGKMTVNTRGMRRLKKRLAELSGDVREGALAAITESGQAVEEDMIANVPVDEGDLRDSIRSEVNRGNLVAEIGPRGSDVYYGYFVEHGTSSRAATPFAGPAHARERKKFPKRVRAHVKKRAK